MYGKYAVHAGLAPMVRRGLKNSPKPMVEKFYENLIKKNHYARQMSDVGSGMVQDQGLSFVDKKYCQKKLYLTLRNRKRRDILNFIKLIKNSSI
jgi:hypothetical protein